MRSKVFCKKIALFVVALVSNLGAVGCSKSSSNAGIDLQIVVGSNVDTFQIAALEFYFDELSGASGLFTVSNLVPQNQLLGGIPYALTTEDVDGDTKFELLFKVAQNVFLTTNALTVNLIGGALSQEFKIVARVKNASGTVIGFGESVATSFASPAAAVTVNVCANGVCGGVDAGTDAGAGTVADGGTLDAGQTDWCSNLTGAWTIAAWTCDGTPFDIGDAGIQLTITYTSATAGMFKVKFFVPTNQTTIWYARTQGRAITANGAMVTFTSAAPNEFCTTNSNADGGNWGPVTTGTGSQTCTHSTDDPGTPIVNTVSCSSDGGSVLFVNTVPDGGEGACTTGQLSVETWIRN